MAIPYPIGAAAITINTDGALIFIGGGTRDDITSSAPTNYSNYVESLHTEGGTDDRGGFLV